MHVHFLDPYRPRVSLIHQLDPRVKLLLAVGLILTASLTPEGVWPVYMLLFSLTLSVVVVSNLGVGYVLKRSALALPFALAALPLLFTTPGAPLISVVVGPWPLAVSAAGVTRLASIFVKSWISMQLAIVLAATTLFPDLLAAMRAVGLPRLLVATVGLMWRYLFVLVDEALRLMRARAARSGETGRPGLRTGGSLAWRARVTGGMAGNLFLRALDRGDRIYLAMAARGYDGEVRTLARPGLTARQKALVAGGWALCAGLLILAYGLGG